MGKKKVVIDNNNLISALGWSGKPRELLQKVIDKEVELVISVKQLDELKRVLNYPKFKFTEQQKTKFLEILSEISTIVKTKSTLDIVKEDETDNIFLELALETDADYIISGDKHLRKLKQFRKTKIVSASEFLK